MWQAELLNSTNRRQLGCVFFGLAQVISPFFSYGRFRYSRVANLAICESQISLFARRRPRYLRVADLAVYELAI